MPQIAAKLPIEERERIAEIISKYTERLWLARGFVGARPGFAVTNGALIRKPAIVAFVRVKLAPEFLSESEALPDQLDGVPVDVVAVDPQTELEFRSGQAGIDPL